MGRTAKASQLRARVSSRRSVAFFLIASNGFTADIYCMSLPKKSKPKSELLTITFGNSFSVLSAGYSQLPYSLSSTQVAPRMPFPGAKQPASIFFGFSTGYFGSLLKSDKLLHLLFWKQHLSAE